MPRVTFRYGLEGKRGGERERRDEDALTALVPSDVTAVPPVVGRLLCSYAPLLSCVPQLPHVVELSPCSERLNVPAISLGSQVGVSGLKEMAASPSQIHLLHPLRISLLFGSLLHFYGLFGTLFSARPLPEPLPVP